MILGVFDSGVGGLAFFRELDRRHPEVSRIYLGDHANLPYGEKTSDEIIELTCNGVAQLINLGCNRIVVACNTASVLALPTLEAKLKLMGDQIDLFDITTPTIRYLENSFSKESYAISPRDEKRWRVGVFATSATVRSEYFTKIISHGGRVEVQQVACHQLVDAIENSESPDQIRLRISSYVEQLNLKFFGKLPHIVVLGCTHYSVVRKYFREVLGDDCKILSQEDLLLQDLSIAPNSTSPKTAQTIRRLLTTGNIGKANSAAKFLTGDITYEFESLQP